MNKTSREVRRRRRILATSAFFAFLAAACGDDGVRARTTSTYVNVKVTAAGGDIDTDGFSIVVDDQRGRVKSGESQSFFVPSGAHVVTLGDIAANCSVVGENPRSVSVDRAAILQVVFEVACAATGVTITTRSAGVDIPTMYGVSVNDQPVPNISANGTSTVTRLTAGPTTVTLSVPENCTVSGNPSLVVDVTLKSVTTVAFDVTCTPVARPEKIAYATDVPTNGQSQRAIQLVNLDGGGVISLEIGDTPSWSPDGKRLVFTSTQCGYYYYYYDTCTSALEVLDPELGFASPLTGGQAEFHPSWAPTGDRIAFDVPGQNGQELRVVNVPSGSAVLLPIQGPRSKEEPAWSPDGQRIVFVCRYDTHMDLCIVNSDGSGLVRLTNDAMVKRRPAWSPDGTTIAFTRYPVDATEPAAALIVQLDLASGRITTLTNGMEPAWSPDGSRLVFAGVDGLFLIRADGTNRTRLTTGPHHAPAWRP